MAYVNLALTHAQRIKSLPKSGAAGRARVIMDAVGSIIVHIDSLPNGQGHRTVVAQIVADEMGVLPEDVEVLSELDTFGGATWPPPCGMPWQRPRKPLSRRA